MKSFLAWSSLAVVFLVLYKESFQYESRDEHILLGLSLALAARAFYTVDLAKAFATEIDRADNKKLKKMMTVTVIVMVLFFISGFLFPLRIALVLGGDLYNNFFEYFSNFQILCLLAIIPLGTLYRKLKAVYAQKHPVYF